MGIGSCYSFVHLWSLHSSRNDYSKIIHQRTNTVPFDLVPHEDGVAVAVRVLKPLDSVDLGLETVYEKFYPSVQSFMDAIGHYISGEQPKGIQETEEMLKVVATLTGVGELVLDNNRGSSLPSQQLLDLKLVRLSLHCNRDRSTMRGC